MVIHGAFSSDRVVVSGPGMGGTDTQTSRRFFTTRTKRRQTETDRETDRPTDRQTGRPTDRLADRPSDRPTDQPTERPDRQIDRLTDRPRQRQRQNREDGHRERPPDTHSDAVRGTRDAHFSCLCSNTETQTHTNEQPDTPACSSSETRTTQSLLSTTGQ